MSRALLTDPVPAGPIPRPPPPPPRGGLNEFGFAVEALDPALGRDFGWKPLAGVVVNASPVRARAARAKGPSIGPITPVTPIRPPIGPIGPIDIDIRVVTPIWKGTVVLPEPIGGRQLRLVAREFELFHEDAEGVFLGKRIARRLVYADTIEL